MFVDAPGGGWPRWLPGQAFSSFSAWARKSHVCLDEQHVAARHVSHTDLAASPGLSVPSSAGAAGVPGDIMKETMAPLQTQSNLSASTDAK